MNIPNGLLIIAGGVVATLIPIPFMPWVGLIMIAWGAYSIWSGKKPGNDPWLGGRSSCQYKWVYDKTGIALDTDARKIHLKNKDTEKTYTFEDIREWKYNVQTGGEIINGSVGTNYGIHLKNKADSGLFILMRDIDHPQWRIAFPYNKKMEGELLKWMEILRQHVNNE